MRRSILLLATAAALCAAPVMAETVINSGGKSGAYFLRFCPPLPNALKKASFAGYKCSESKGTLENIARVMADEQQVGIVQSDVYMLQSQANPEISAKTTIVRQLACEGVWMVSNDSSISNFGAVQALARRIPIFVAKDSGSSATLDYLRTLDPKGIGRAKNVIAVKDTAEALERVKASDGPAIAFFVQFADPENPNIKTIVDGGLTVVPVLDEAFTDVQFNGDNLYQVRPFSFEKDGWVVSGAKYTTICTPAALIAANPDAMKDPGDQEDQRDMIKTMAALPDDVFLPQESWLAKMMKASQRLGHDAIREMVAGVHAARAAAEKALN